ncbi:MAG: hypothetical protein FWG87_08520 [Defluviitaleaceae bacterium]|nr:hypothetical protein [Defluviitaleaceae bacterium]
MKYNSVTEILNDTAVGKISLIGNPDSILMPMWAINHYITELCNNYNKITTIRKICQLAQSGVTPEQVYIHESSAKIFLDKPIKELYKFNMNTFINLSSKLQMFPAPYERTKIPAFWCKLSRLKRPLVFIKQGDDFIPLIDVNYYDSIKITSLAYNSPIQIDLQGGLSGLKDLFYAGKRFDMETAEHIAKQIGQGTDNIGKIASAGQVVEDERTPSWIKKYAQNELEFLLHKQHELNKMLGMRVKKIDKLT